MPTPQEIVQSIHENAASQIQDASELGILTTYWGLWTAGQKTTIRTTLVTRLTAAKAAIDQIITDVGNIAN